VSRRPYTQRVTVRQRSILWLGSAAAVVGGAALVGDEAPVLQLGPLMWLAGSLAVVAAFHYRTSKDPDTLLLGTAGTVITVQSLLFGVVWRGEWILRVSGVIQDGSIDLARRGAIELVASLAGLAIAGGCLVIAWPWWDRRGRQPIAPLRFSASVLAVVLITDLLLVAFPPVASLTVVGRVPVVSVPPIGWIWLGAGVCTWTFVTIRHTQLFMRGVEHGPLAAAGASAVAVLASWAALDLGPGDSPAWTIGIRWLLPFGVLGFLLVAVLLMERAETSRLRRTSDRAERIVEGRAEIASMIAHEVRGPVTTIRGIAATAATHYDGLSDAERQEFFGLIEQESRRLLGAVDQTSLALKVDAGSLTYEMAPAELAPIVRAGVEAAHVEPDEHPLHIVAQEDVTLTGDQARLTEVVRQLVENAAKFSPAGSPIVVRAVDDDEHASLEVTDEGPGIPVERREAVFERFGRWRPKGYEDQPGNGLGLFICRGLVAEHHGEITVEDGPTGGTMLRVRLPLGGT
jgi:signal transduction histidine kinase